jgi:uncharacterized protein with HEPN domain
MKLIVIGDTVKTIDKRTDKTLLPLYPSIPWRQIMGTRNFIAHQYHDVDPWEVFSILVDDLPPLLTTIRRMQQDVSVHL